MIFTKAKDMTLDNFTAFSAYETFMANSSQEEFSRSQIPFYHAVKAFPRILCYLGSMIEDSATRLHIAENIWEEHGNGEPQNFHINTFHNYLTAIAGPDYILANNPWVDEWIANWFKETDVLALSCKLAAIEYLYAPISGALAKHIETLSLHNVQHHYSKHAELDWEHGRELFEVALQYDSSEDKSKAFSLFDAAQKEFISVFNGMILLTQKEVLDIAKDKIAFYYLREDASVSVKALDHLKADAKKNIITICSGGESIMEYLALPESAEIFTLDMNRNQYDLFLEKLTKMGKDDQVIDELNIGKFERIFKSIRERFTEEEQREFLLTGFINKDKLRYAINDTFSRNNLAIIFTEDAVKYTKKDFAEHFFTVFTKEFEDDSFGKENIQNILAGVPFDYYSKKHLNLKNKAITPVIEHINNGKIFENISFSDGRKADLIDLSNIGDWVEPDALRAIINASKQNLNKGGALVMRKLLGDYSLYEEMKAAGLKVSYEEDTGGFYEETVVGYHHE